MKKLMVLAKLELFPHQRGAPLVERDGRWVPALAKALVWSSDPADFERGIAYAAREGYRPLLMDDTPDVLDRARKQMMEQFI